MKKLIYIIAVLLVTNAYGQEQAVVELPMNDEVVQIVQEDPVVQKVITEQAPAQVVQVPAQTTAPAPVTKKVVTTKQVITTQPVPPASVKTAPPQPTANVQQPVVVQPVVVQPVVLQPKTVEAAPAVPAVETSAPAKPVVTDTEKTNAKPEDVNKNVKIKKNKDGTNIYNFNFYNSKTQPAPKAKTPVITKAAPLPRVKRSPIRSGSGPQLEFFITNYNGDDTGMIDFESGTKLSYRLMHKESGFYVAPGYIKSTTDTVFTTGDSTGFMIRLGKMSNDYRKFYLDYGIEYSKVEGESNSYWGWGSDSSFETSNFSAYISPSLRWGAFGIAWPIQIGTSQFDGSYSEYTDTFSSGSWNSYSTVTPISGSTTFFTLGMSASLYF